MTRVGDVVWYYPDDASAAQAAMITAIVDGDAGVVQLVLFPPMGQPTLPPTADVQRCSEPTAGSWMPRPTA